MIDTADVQAAALARFASLLVATTPGGIELAATATEYVRTDGGSFVADKFVRGMQVTPAGFASSAPRVITAVAADRLTVDTTPANGGPLAVQAAAPGRSLSVGVPAMLKEDESFTPKAGVPYAEMQYAGGPRRLVSMGDGADGAEVDLRPMLIFYVHVRANTGLAARRYADATLRLFAPGLVLIIAGEEGAYVNGDPAPYDTQIQASSPGFVTIPVVVPLWITTFNTL